MTTANRLMPRRGDRIALLGHVDEVCRLLRNRYAKGRYGDPADLVFVDKSRRGRRPISEMSLADRVLFRGLVTLIAQSLPDHLVTRSPNAEFQRSPLEVDGVRYVGMTDITSFYEYVDHDLLAEELEAQTGEAPAIAVLMTLLERVMGRRVGLPQVHRSSDVLGDTYIDVARRRLRRESHEVTRYSDDFRIANTSLADARQALEACARAVRALGLTLNEGKTRTWTRDNYERSLTALSDAEAALFEEDGGSGDLSLLADDGYDDLDGGAESARSFAGAPAHAGALDDDALDDSDRDESAAAEVPDGTQTRAAGRALTRWLDVHGSGERQTEIDASATVSLVARALPILGRAGQEEALDDLSRLLRAEPALTPQVCVYLVELGRTGKRARTRVRHTLDGLASESSFSSWQQMWLADTAGRIRPATRDVPHYGWLAGNVRNADPALAATSAAALGRLGRADVAQVAAALDRFGPAWRPLALWGVALRAREAAVEAGMVDDRLDRLLVDAAGDVRT